VTRRLDTAAILAELRARLDLEHYPERVARRLEAAFERHANGDADGLTSLLRAARHLRVTGAKAKHYASLARQVRRARRALREDAPSGPPSA
jgi:hypothetical protein